MRDHSLEPEFHNALTHVFDDRPEAMGHDHHVTTVAVGEDTYARRSLEL